MADANEEPKGEDDPLVGTLIAERYRVESRIGEGGMGTVYRVEHAHMRKRFALKVLHPELSNYDEVVARFEREAMAAANIEHPNIANATDFGKLPDGSFYLVLEYVEGTDLRALLQRDTYINPARAVHIALQILGALGRAHELGIVHRDLKPENVLLLEKDGDPEFVKILDFGIARVPVGSLGSTPKGGENKPLTKAGTVYGTPEYMAPEQALGHQVDGRADLYAVGVLLFEMLAGARPYDDKDKIALLGAHVSKPIPKLRTRVPKEQFIPDGLEAVVTRLLAKSPDERFQTAGEVAGALLDLGFDAPMPITRHPSNRSDRSGAHAMADLTPSARKLRISADSSGELSAPKVSESATTESQPISVKSALPIAEPAAPAAPKSSKLPWVIAIVSLGIAAAAVFVLRKQQQQQQQQAPAGPVTSVVATASTSAQSTAQPSVAPSTAASNDVKEAALRALGRIASGETDAGLKELESLVAAHPKDPVVLRAMAQGYDKAKRSIDAMTTMRVLAALSVELATDPMLVPVYEDALSDPKGVDEALLVLTGPLGANGDRILYDFAFGEHGTAVGRGRALRALKSAKNVPPGLRAAIDIRSAPSCAAKKAAIEKDRKELDGDTLPLLTAMAKPTCGPNKKQDCWPCLEKLLPEVVKETEAKSPK